MVKVQGRPPDHTAPETEGALAESLVRILPRASPFAEPPSSKAHGLPGWRRAELPETSPSRKSTVTVS